ncbi:MAG: porin family protein [Bacteroidales bacterium]|nr:porin family protein [Bacteroidales bacterium]
MKKFLLAIAAALVVCSMNVKAETRLGATAGFTYNKVHFAQSDIFRSDYMPGANLGVMGELMIPGVGFGVDASLLYSMRNGKLHFEDKKAWSSMGIGAQTATFHYIDIPINLKFRYHNLNGLENTFMPMAFAGPVISVLAGHSKCADQLSYSKVGLSIQMGLGCELFEKVQVKAGYQFGVGAACNTKLLDEHTAKNRTWFLNATYFFK